MLCSTVNNLNASFSLFDLDQKNQETDASTNNQSGNLFSDDSRNPERKHDSSSFSSEEADGPSADAPRIESDHPSSQFILSYNIFITGRRDRTINRRTPDLFNHVLLCIL